MLQNRSPLVRALIKNSNFSVHKKNVRSHQFNIDGMIFALFIAALNMALADYEIDVNRR